MLRFLRKYSRSVGVKILYGLLALLFIGWGVGTFGDDQVQVVARVYGSPITRRQLETATLELQRRYESVLRNAEALGALNVRGQALDQLIEQTLLEHEARRLGIGVTDEEIVEAVTRFPQFQDGGRFSRERLEAALQTDRGELEQALRERLLFHRLRTLVTDGVQVSDGEVEERYRLDRTRVNLAFAKIASADMAPTPSTDEELEKYLAEHADRYRVPTRVRVRFVVYRPDDAANRVAPSEGEIDEYYVLHKEDRFAEPEQVRARHILVKLAPGADEAARSAARVKAEALRAKAASGADFAALAKAESEDPGSKSQGGDLGLSPRGRMHPAFESAAFALAPGEVSEVVETAFGFHVIKVEEHHPAGSKPLASVRDEIVQTLTRERGLERARQQAEAVRKAVVGGKTLDEAVTDRSPAETPLFAADEEVPGVGRVKPFSDAAFGYREGEVSDLVETEEAIYLLSPVERVEAHTPPLADVRSRVETDARRDRAAALAKERAEQLLAKAREVGLDKAAAEAGVKVEQTGPFDRRVGTIPQIGTVPDLATAALGLTSAQPVAGRVYMAAGDAFVVALRERIPADMAEFESTKSALHDGLLQEKRSAAGDAYLDYLKQQAQREGALEVRVEALERG